MGIIFHSYILLILLTATTYASASFDPDAAKAYVECAAYYKIKSTALKSERKAETEKLADANLYSAIILSSYDLTKNEIETATAKIIAQLRDGGDQAAIAAFSVKKYEDYCGRVVPEKYASLVTRAWMDKAEFILNDFEQSRKAHPLVSTVAYLSTGNWTFGKLERLGPFYGIFGRIKLFSILMMPFLLVFAFVLPVSFAFHMKKKELEIFKIVLGICVMEISYITFSCAFLSWALGL